MPRYRVPVTIINSGYCDEEAESLDEVIQLIEDGNYEDIYGESFVDLHVDDSKKIEIIDEAGDIILDDEDLALLKDEEDEDDFYEDMDD
jgi:hypothetical protein